MVGEQTHKGLYSSHNRIKLRERKNLATIRYHDHELYVETELHQRRENSVRKDPGWRP